MYYHALNQAITLYRGEALTLDQASCHAGVSNKRMKAALRSRNVPIRRPSSTPAIDNAGAD